MTLEYELHFKCRHISNMQPNISVQEDANHFSQEWTYRKQRKDQTATFHYVRKQ